MTSLHAFELPPIEDSQTPTAVWRRVLATLVGLVGVALAGLFGYGSVDPRRYVFFLTYFNDPFAGLVLVLVCVVLAYILAFPVRSTVIDRRRSLTRTTLLISTAVATIVFLFAYELAIFRYDPEVLSTSSSGQRAIARVGLWKATEMHVYAGRGLGRRDVGSLGAPCGLASQMDAKFLDENEIAVATAYNDYRIHLEAGTGRPLDKFGPLCSE